MIKISLFSIILSLLLPGAIFASERQSPNTSTDTKIIIFVRHAKKAVTQDKDPSLSTAGQSHGSQLATSLKNMP